MELVDLLSPMRAERVRMVNELAGTEQHYISLSENGIAGMFRAIFVLALLVYYYSLKKVISADERAYYMLFYCMIFVGVIEALYGLIQFVNPGIGILWLKVTGGRAAHGTIIYKNQYASLLNMIWPLAVGGAVMFFVGRKGKRRQGEGRKKAQDIFKNFINKTAGFAPCCSVDDDHPGCTVFSFKRRNSVDGSRWLLPDHIPALFHEVKAAFALDMLFSF